ncbi:MAG TPA: prolyl oligopeptidase family serine peptidase [Blastocatellia bacterium]|nr:prolyl oligopeptidase family serine peptidase [Blastocatellia bacterium]
MISSVTRRLLFALCVTVACAVMAAAQDAGQVLRVSVGFNTLRNTLKDSAELTPEKLAEVDRLGQMAQAAAAEKRYEDALKHYYQGLALMQNQPWTPWRAMSSALRLKIDRAVLEPNQSASIRLWQIFALDQKPEGKLSGTVALLKASSSTPVSVLKTLEGVEPDFMTNAAAMEIRAPEIEDGNYKLEVKLKATEGDPIVRTIAVRIERGLASQVAAAKARVEKIKAALGAKKQDELLASAEYRVALFDLASASEINFERINFREQLNEANAMLDELEAGRDPFAARRGDFKKAYRSKVDNTLQPYRVFVPASYDRAKAHPLVVALHGMGGDENSYFDSYKDGAFKVEAERRGYIVACPKGREPASMYLGAAEQDVLDVIAEVRRAYNVDADRIYVTGHSMGGFGSWSIAMSRPELFAAIAPIAGGGNPIGMKKIAHIPQLVVHGDNDKTVPVERSRMMVTAGKSAGAEIKYLEIPGGNHIDVAAATFKDVFDWFDAHRRKSADAKAAAGGAKTN